MKLETARQVSTSDLFYRIATGSLILSAITIILLGVSVPLLYSRTNQHRDSLEFRSDKFREDTNRLWNSLKKIPSSLEADPQPAGPSIQFYTRKARSSWEKQICSGCNQLGCQTGPPGLAGPPGEDGQPGNAGKSGKIGEDGFDVELEPENDLPCVICPGGPPGQRGLQGERGQTGYPGQKGQSGPPGSPGVDGPIGNVGPVGNPGRAGILGPVGPSGDITIAGVGIKGPKGPPGSAGPKGPFGPSGKTSKEQGPPGPVGPPGIPGVGGAPGRIGERGSFGVPGEPGIPASYCPSDCGVSQIVAPSMHIASAQSPSNEPESQYEEKAAVSAPSSEPVAPASASSYDQKPSAPAPESSYDQKPSAPAPESSYVPAPAPILPSTVSQPAAPIAPARAWPSYEGLSASSMVDSEDQASTADAVNPYAGVPAPKQPVLSERELPAQAYSIPAAGYGR